MYKILSFYIRKKSKTQIGMLLTRQQSKKHKRQILKRYYLQLKNDQIYDNIKKKH